jgi:hypothetical protein
VRPSRNISGEDITRRWVSAPLVLTSFCLILLPAALALANPPAVLQDSLANAYIYIASRTTWNPERQSSFRFCVNRNNDLFETFSAKLPQKKIGNRRIELSFYDEGDPGALRACDLIALGEGETFNRAVIEKVRGAPVLTISHQANITEYGGLVQIVFKDKLQPPRIGFSSLEASGLKIDASILNLSRGRWGE